MLRLLGADVRPVCGCIVVYVCLSVVLGEDRHVTSSRS